MTNETETGARPVNEPIRPRTVAVFAHNESRSIVDCLDSIAAASPCPLDAVHVLANGCTDDTKDVVLQYAKNQPWVRLVTIDFGDKSNAWNVFVHDIAPTGDCIFVDGDVRIEPGSLDVLSKALADHPEANAAAAVPATGRNRRMLSELVTEHRLILGNLYALRETFLDRARRTGARIPVGYIGDDCLVTSLAKWDLDPTGPFVHELVVPCPEAMFAYRSLSPFSPRDWRAYWNRRVRYSLRYFQKELIDSPLQSHGIAGLPPSVADLYVEQSNRLPEIRPRRGADFVFDRIALHRIRTAIDSRVISRAGALP